MQGVHKKNARRRKLNYQKSILQEELAIYNRQKEIVPILGILLVFGVLFIFLNLNFAINSSTSSANKLEDGFELEVTTPGVYQIDIKNTFKLLYEKDAERLKSEIFIKQNDKKLYHYFLDPTSASEAKSQRINYYFREAGVYQLQFRHSLVSTTRNVNEAIKVNEVRFQKRSGNTSLISWGSRLYLLALIIILLLKDYFGPVKNYAKIIRNKEYNLKKKSVYVALTTSIIWLGLGYALASTGYGFAGYKNDMHAPAKNLQIDNNYYIN
ncbi:hypothetical protein [Lishizhenia sp.]|uniref:hypothetical protein n=1 Tax=Lishizhenia sp. TaxID=2497594 RepID=UPI00299E39C4|nr:hypothetical protein [Lishizhenia sp.]MDX1446149.1 hypothetical protein [Lishizhenia sp.]